MSLLDQLVNLTHTSYINALLSTSSTEQKNDLNCLTKSENNHHFVGQKGKSEEQKMQRLMHRLMMMLKNKMRKKYYEFWVVFQLYQKLQNNPSKINQQFPLNEANVQEKQNEIEKSRREREIENIIMGCKITQHFIDWKKSYYNSEFLINLHERMKFSFKLQFTIRKIQQKMNKMQIFYGFQSLQNHLNETEKDGGKEIIVRNCQKIEVKSLKTYNPVTKDKQINLNSLLPENIPHFSTKLHTQQIVDSFPDLVDNCNVFFCPFSNSEPYQAQTPLPKTFVEIKINNIPFESEKTKKKGKKLSVLSSSSIFSENSKNTNSRERRSSFMGTVQKLWEDDRKALANIISSFKNSPNKDYKENSHDRVIEWKRKKQYSGGKDWWQTEQVGCHKKNESEVLKEQRNRIDSKNEGKKQKEKQNKIVISLKNRRKFSEVEGDVGKGNEKRHIWKGLYEQKKKERQNKEWEFR